MTTRLQEAGTDPAVYAASLYDALTQLGTITGEAEAAMLEALDGARAEIQAQLAALPWDSPSRAMLNRALSGVNQTTANLAQTMGKTIADYQAAGYAAGADLAIKPIAGQRGLDVLAAGVTLDQLQLQTLFSAELVQDIADETRKRINAEINAVVLGAKSPTAAAAAIGHNLYDANHFASIAHRARAITVTEVGRAASLGTQNAQIALQQSLNAAGGGEKVRKRWLNAHLPGARLTHLEAEAAYAPGGSIGPIPYDGFFQIGGFKALYPKDPALPPSESVHCHCITLTIVDEGSATAASSETVTADAKTAYTQAKAEAAAPATAKQSPAPLDPPAATFLEDPYGSAGLSPVKPLKDGTNGYGGQVMANKLGYTTAKQSGFVWDKELGAWKHPKAPSGKQLPDFADLNPSEQLALMKQAGLSSSAQTQIVKHLDLDTPSAKALPDLEPEPPAAAPPPPPPPAPPPPPPPPPPTTAIGKIKAAIKAKIPTKGYGRPTVPGAKKFKEAGEKIAGNVGSWSTPGRLKDTIMRELGGTLARHYTTERLQEFLDTYPRRYSNPGAFTNVGDEVASMLIRTWASTSGDSHPGSLAVQRAVAAIWDLPWPPVGYGGPAILEAETFYAANSDVLETFLQAMYEHTQRTLIEEGYGKTITLARGMDYPGLGAYTNATAQVMLNPASSFSVQAAKAKQFSGATGITFYAEIPRERILGTALSGFGCFNEYEFVVIGSAEAEEMWAVGKYA